MNTGQMVDDVKIAVKENIQYTYGRTGGMVPTPGEIVEKSKKYTEVKYNGSSI